MNVVNDEWQKYCNTSHLIYQHILYYIETYFRYVYKL